MRKKAKKFPLDGYIKAAIDRVWVWWPPRIEAKERAKLFNGNYSCEQCGGRFERKGVQVDHIDPVIDTKKGFEGWDMYVKRKFVSVGKLQALCKKCHVKKSGKENKKRRRDK